MRAGVSGIAMTSLKDLLVSAGISFVGAFLTCISNKRGFDMACVYEGLGVIGTGMVTYHIGLWRSAPGQIQLPADFAGKVQK